MLCCGFTKDVPRRPHSGIPLLADVFCSCFCQEWQLWWSNCFWFPSPQLSHWFTRHDLQWFEKKDCFLATKTKYPTVLGTRTRSHDLFFRKEETAWAADSGKQPLHTNLSAMQRYNMPANSLKHRDVIAYATRKSQIIKLQIAWRYGEVISVRPFLTDSDISALEKMLQFHRFSQLKLQSEQKWKCIVAMMTVDLFSPPNCLHLNQNAFWEIKRPNIFLHF